MKFTKTTAIALMFSGFEVISMPVSKRPSVGFFPFSFPRDPININVYLEHILVGQILEPLVESGPDSTIVPAVAESWEFSPDGRTLTFILKRDILFSNGKNVTPEDVKYTLERHITSHNSQSKPYLKRIKKIEINKKQNIVLHLDGPYVAMLKALSRDQLGIVPKNWRFSPKSNEPFIGTGAYRAIRENGGWVLKKNLHFRNAHSVSIPEWDLVFQKSVAEVTKVPAIIPFAYSSTIDELKKTKEWATGEFNEEPVVHFFQSSAWWYPKGNTFYDSERRNLGMCAIKELISLRIAKRGLHQATGLIPEGISGHLAKMPNINCPINPNLPQNRKFTVVALDRELAVLDNSADKRRVEKQFGAKLKLVSLALHAPESALTELKPDIFVLGFAGGFHDPEGFLTVISSMLCSDQKTIFQTDYKSYLDAASETNWDIRSRKYQDINSHLVTQLRMIPGWKVHAERVRHRSFISNRNDLRYTAKLKDYKLGKEVP